MSLTKSPYGIYISSFTKPAELTEELKAKVVATNRGWEIPGAGSHLPGVSYASHSLEAYEVLVPVPNLSSNHVYLLEHNSGAPIVADSTFVPGTKVYSQTGEAGTDATIISWAPFHAKKFTGAIDGAGEYTAGTEVEYRTANTLSTGQLIGKGIVLRYLDSGGSDILTIQVTEGNFEKPSSGSYYIINKTTPANNTEITSATVSVDVGALIVSRQVSTGNNDLFVGATNYSSRVQQLGSAATDTSYRQTVGLHKNGWVYPQTSFAGTSSLGSIAESLTQVFLGETTYEYQKNNNPVGFGISVSASPTAAVARFSPGFGIWKIRVTPGVGFAAAVPGAVLDANANNLTTDDFNATILKVVGNDIYVFGAAYHYKLTEGSTLYTNVASSDDVIGTVVSIDWVRPSDPHFAGVYSAPETFVVHGLVVTNNGTAKLPVGTSVSYTWSGISYTGVVVATSFNDGANTESFTLLTNSPNVALATAFVPTGEASMSVHSTHNPVLRPGGTKSVTLAYYGQGSVTGTETLTYTVSSFEYDNQDLDGTSTGANVTFTKTVTNVA